MIMKKLMLMITILMAGSLYAQQTDLSLIPYRSGDKWGYSTPDKKVVIKPAFNEANRHNFDAIPDQLSFVESDVTELSRPANRFFDFVIVTSLHIIKG